MNELTKIKNSIIKRHYLIILILFFLFLILSISGSYFYNKKVFIDQNIKYCNDVANIILNSNIVIDLFKKTDDEKYKEISYLSMLDTRITLIDCNGKVLYDNKVDASYMKSHFDRKSLLRLNEKETSYEITTSKTLGKKLFYFSKKIEISGTCIGFVRISRELNSLKQNNYFYLILFLIFFLIFTLLTLLLLNINTNYFFGFQSFISYYLQQIDQSKENPLVIENNDLLYTKQLKNELKYIILNKIDDLKQKIYENEFEILLNIIDQFNEGNIIFDENGKCIYTNKKALEILFDNNQSQILEKYYWEIILNKEISENINKVFENKKSELFESEINNGFYNVKIQYLSKLKAILISFSDISEIKRYYELRKNILSSMSHEIKTPLTSINGFLEQIIQDAESKNDNEISNYATIAKRNCDRLINITNDIISIEKMNYRMNLELEEIDIIMEIKQILNLYEYKASKKKIKLNFKSEYDSLSVKSSSLLFNQIMNNLIDNAIKFSEKGNVNIEIQKNNRILIIVEDEGIGIEEVEIPKIFEPFYSVDKSGNKAKSGSGLGLSIVKNAIDKLKWKIQVVSVINKGTKFIIEIPSIS